MSFLRIPTGIAWREPKVTGMLLFTLPHEIIQTRDIQAAVTVTHTGEAGRKQSCESYGSGMIGADKDVPAQGDRAAVCLC